MDIKSEEVKQIILDNNSRFSYTVKQVEITNILGAAIGILDEYFITNSVGENYKLFKTKEGNWYDVQGANNGVDKGILLRLKFAIGNNK